MYIDTELRDFLRVLLTRGMQVDLTGKSIHHTHNRIDETAPRPPMKFHLCTPESRPEGRLTQADVDMIGKLCWRYVRQKGLHIPALASVPRVGDEIAKAIQKAARNTGVLIPRLTFSKYTENGVGYIGPLVSNVDYATGQAVWLADDLVHKVLSKKRTMERAQEANYIVRGLLVFMDYGQGAREYFTSMGIAFHAVVELRPLLYFGKKESIIPDATYRPILEYLNRTRRAAA